jgi:hypothetical protein
MERMIVRRLLISSLLVAGAAGSMSACTAADPVLPTDPDPVTQAAKAPPAISGGTLLVTSNNIAVAADSDRDLVWLVDLSTHAITKVALKAGDEPGRVIEDGAGRVHVGLRGSGSIATIDLASAKIVDRTAVCSAPRGLAYDAKSDAVHVACAGGELVTLPASGGKATRALRLDRDLRDVVVQGDNLIISRFRAAELLVVDAEGNVLNRQTPPKFGSNFNQGPEGDTSGGTTFTPQVAWRTVALPGGGAVFTHQRSADAAVVTTTPDGYGSNPGDPCGDGTIVTTTVSTVDADGNVNGEGAPAPTVIGASVVVDLATDGAGNLALASVGNDAIFFTSMGEIDPSNGQFNCNMDPTVDPGGQPVAVAAWNGQWIAQTREPAGLAFIQNGSVSRLELPGETIQDTGHFLFHHNASDQTHLACASCHPEGHEDGHIWHFDTSGARRTQTVAGGVLDTAPLHWNGDMEDLGSIMHEVFVHRMGGAPKGPRHIAAFGDWLQSIPAHPASPSGTQAQIDHGKALFFRADVACGTCHSGAHFTNNQNHDVGTGLSIQVPTLIGVAARSPLFHDGCAASLEDRFDVTDATKVACAGGEQHGHIAQLSDADRADLVKYLETL